MRTAVATAACALAAFFVAAMRQVAGAFGATLACGLLGVSVLLLLRSRIAAPHTQAPGPPRGSAPSGRSFPAFRRVEGRLWSAVRSPRLYDHGTRPMLTRTTALLVRHATGVDLVEEPERAQSLLGDEAWLLVDPRPALSEDSQSPGVPLEAIDRLITRLEDL
jgi:hypothetical protein